MPGNKKKNLWVIPVTAAAVAVLAGGALLAKGMIDKKSQTPQAGTENTQTQTTSGQVSWDGKQYVYNEHLSNFLFLGVDNREKAATSQGQADAGQSDVLFLVSWDRVEHDITLISIPRDTMTEIEAFDTAGQSLGKAKDHISLAYAYGDGSNQSCELTKAAVSNLFYGLPIQGYCSVNMDGIPIMTEDIGGLTVTVPDDSLEQAHPEFQEGAEVELTKENTEAFVRYRDINESQSALKRMKRQSVFMDAYAAKAAEEFKTNPGFITTLYQDLQPYMVTNMGVDQFAKIMKDAAGEGEQTRWTVPGEGVEGVSFDEYHVDDAKLYEMILQTFYEEAK